MSQLGGGATALIALKPIRNVSLYLRWNAKTDTDTRAPNMEQKVHHPLYTAAESGGTGAGPSTPFKRSTESVGTTAEHTAPGCGAQ